MGIADSFPVLREAGKGREPSHAEAGREFASCLPPLSVTPRWKAAD
jgi:hypothetical protein